MLGYCGLVRGIFLKIGFFPGENNKISPQNEKSCCRTTIKLIILAFFYTGQGNMPICSALSCTKLLLFFMAAHFFAIINIMIVIVTKLIIFIKVISRLY
jgi:hypothetical protein